MNSNDVQERSAQRWIIFVILGLFTVPVLLVTGALVGGVGTTSAIVNGAEKQGGTLQGKPLLGESSALRNTGARLFAARCQTCHGYQGRGGIGPSLQDATWLHGSQEADIYRSITEGFPNKGMIAWGGLLPENELRSLVLYVQSLSREGGPPAATATPHDQ